MIEEISEKLIKVTKNVADTTQQQVDVLKMKSSIKNAEVAMENAYKEIGKLLFEKNASEIPVEYVVAIREAKVKITECKEKIIRIKGIQFCKECGQKIKDNKNFCSNCGAKIPKVKVSADTEKGEIKVVQVKSELV